MLRADADYGRSWEPRHWCREVGLRYPVGVHATQPVWDAASVWGIGETTRLAVDTRRGHPLAP